MSSVLERNSLNKFNFLLITNKKQKENKIFDLKLFENQFKVIKEIRSEVVAPVDTMGCDMLADKTRNIDVN